MHLEMIKKVITDQIDEVNALLNNNTLIERDIEDPTKYLKDPNILSILGVRRSGKSTLALKIAEKVGNFGYVNFDDERLYGIESKELSLLLEAWIEVLGREPDLLLLDEIQNVEGWELFVNRMRRTRRVIITGSNAHLLEGDLSTHLTGRYIDLHMFPFSFSEYLRYRGVTYEQMDLNSTRGSSSLRKELKDFIEYGGFPEVYSIGSDMLPRIYKDIILKDAILKNDIRNRKAFNEVARYLISNHSREFTYSRISKVCNITNKNMVSEYVGYLEEVEIVFHLERYSKKLSEQYNSPKKAYCIDTGLIGSIGFNISENRGLLMENLVAVELKRRSKREKESYELYYWKDHSQNEVDFVIRKGLRIEKLIQVAFSIDDEDTKKREKEALIKGSNLLDCDDLMIITWNEEGSLEIQGKTIHYVPLYKWLLS